MEIAKGKWQQVEIAEQIARMAHDGQKEESTGADYIHHLERVVALVETEGEYVKAVAWLHDVLEDTAMTERHLRDAGMSGRIIRAVKTLTRSRGESYKSYIDRVVEQDAGLEVVVKVADLRDHLRPNCPEGLRPRYEKALALLTARLFK